MPANSICCSGHIPVVPLNFTAISNEVALRREIAESAVKEVILALSHSLAANKSVEMELVGIGKLLFIDKKVQMKFYKEFVGILDSSGEMGRAFQRCNTASSDMSIMSGPATPRSSVDQGPCTLPSIKEHPISSGPELQVIPFASAVSKPQSGAELGASKAKEDPFEAEEKTPPGSLQVETPKPAEPRPTQTSRQSSRQSLCVATASGVFYGSEDTPKAPPSSNQNSRKPSTTLSATAANGQTLSVQTTPSGQRTSPCLDLPPLNPAPPTSKRRTRSLSPARSRRSTPLAGGPSRASIEVDHTKASSPCRLTQKMCN